MGFSIRVRGPYVCGDGEVREEPSFAQGKGAREAKRVDGQ